MGGDVVSFPSSEGGDLAGRVASLEGRMTAVEKGVAAAASAAATAASNTAELLSIAKAAKGFAGFMRQHGRTIAGFGLGLLAAAGYDSPALDFVKHFLGL